MGRFNVEQVKLAQGYRQNCIISLVCNNCIFKSAPTGYAVRHRCSIGNFAIELTSSCLKHRKEKR